MSRDNIAGDQPQTTATDATADATTGASLHDVLIQRDHVIGLEASLGRARAKNRVLAGENKLLIAELKTIRKTPTWRAGRVVMSPLSLLKRLARGTAGE